MKLPGKHTNTGRVLRAMYGKGWLTAGEIRKAARMHPDTAVTARIRDLRHIPGVDLPPAEVRKNAAGGRSYYYHIARLSPRVRAELKWWREVERRAAA